MKAMVLHGTRMPLRCETMPDPQPNPGEIRMRVGACGVCRTDLHVINGELPHPKLPLVPGHEIVGRIDALGPGVVDLQIGDRVGIPWLGHTDGTCPYCLAAQENLCDHPVFTGYTRNGGYATHAIADAHYTFPLGEDGSDEELAPLLCAGLIGWRSFVRAGTGDTLGLYGFGAAAHIIAQVAAQLGRRIFAFTSPGDRATQEFARSLGVVWAGGSDEMPSEKLDAAIIYAPVGPLVPRALAAVKKGGTVVCAGIHMSDIPQFPYDLLREERKIVSVANLTRQDGLDFLKIAAGAKIKTYTTPYPLNRANEALDDLQHGRLHGAAVLIPPQDDPSLYETQAHTKRAAL